MSEFDDDQHLVSIEVPALGEYVSVIRALAASLAARCDLTVDEIDDLRIGVDEACGLLLALLTTAGEPPAEPVALSAVFTLAEGSVRLRASMRAKDARPDDSGFAWTVLHAVADEVHVSVEDDRVSIELCKQRRLADF